MKQGSITSFIEHHGDYFAAHLDNGLVRLGLRGEICFDFPVEHPMYSTVSNARGYQVENLHDQMMSLKLTSTIAKLCGNYSLTNKSK